jgi:hypothetical protein
MLADKMKFTFFLCSGILTFAHCADPIDVLLNKTWISDKSETVKWLTKNRSNISKNDKLLDIFGKMSISFTKNEMTAHNGGGKVTRTHKIIGQTAREIGFITNDPLLNRDVIVVIEIDEDEKGYWIYNNQFDIKEHFIPIR